MKGIANVTIVLDACRERPYKSCARGGAATGFRGLQRSPPGMLIVNSTAPGALAADGDKGAGSPFLRIASEKLKAAPGAYFREVFDDVAREVYTLTNGNQVPEVLARGGAPKICLSGKCGVQVAVVTPVPVVATPPSAVVTPPVSLPVAPVKPVAPSLHAYLTRGYEDRASRLVRTFTGHTSNVSSVAISPDGRFALSGSGDNKPKLWDVSTGREVRAFTGHTHSVSSVAFSPDGRFALSGSGDKTLKLWEVSTGREVRAFTGHTSWVPSVAFSPDGRFALSGSADDTLKLWDVSTGREVRAFTGHTGSVYSVAFSPDGRFALSGSDDKTLKLWDVSTGREVRAFTGHTGYVYSVAFSPDGRFALSGSADDTLKLWDVSTGREVRAFTGHTYPVSSVAFSPDGRYFVSGADVSVDDRKGLMPPAVTLWDRATGLLVAKLTGQKIRATSVTFSPDGRFILSGSDDKTLKLWDVSEWTGAGPSAAK